MEAYRTFHAPLVCEKCTVPINGYWNALVKDGKVYHLANSPDGLNCESRRTDEVLLVQ